MRIVITGAASFIGCAVVRQAATRGHQVVAIVRPDTKTARLAALSSERVTLASIDLAKASDELDAALRNTDAVVHLAMASDKKGRHQIDETVLMTRNLLGAMSRSGTNRIVLASSFSVYDYAAAPTGSVVDEQFPVISATTSRDSYSSAKVLQESAIIEHASKQQVDVRILRLGAVYGPKHTWTARLGWKLSSRLWLRVGSFAPIPLSYIEHSADALLRAAETVNCNGLIVNVLDDSLPSQSEYARAIGRHASPKPFMITIPWKCAYLAASLTSKIFGGLPFIGKRLPSGFNPKVISARFKPFAYTNRVLHDSLGWKPRVTLQEALDACYRPAMPLNTLSDNPQ